MRIYRLLIVDDNKLSRDTIEFIIKSNYLPFEISQAKNGIEALEYIKKKHFDCVITDIKMPRMSGVELVGAAKELNCDAVFLICSGYRDFSDAKAAIEYGVENYILKPIDVIDFLRILNNIVANIESSYAKKAELLEKKLCHYLSDGVICNSDEVLDILKSVSRIIVVKFRGKEIYNSREQIKREINSLSGYEVKLVSLDKNTDIILYSKSNDFEKEPNDYILNLKQIYNKVDRNNFFILASKQIDNPDLILTCLNQTAILTENKLFQSDKTTAFADNLDSLDNDEASICERRVYDAIDENNFTEIKNLIEKYFNIVQTNSMASTIFIKFQASGFVKAIMQNNHKGFDTQSIKAIEDIGRVETIVDLKRIINNFIDCVSQNNLNEVNETTIVKAVKKIIEAEYQNELTLEYLASRVFLSPAYLSNAFKQQVGVNLFSYIATIRMQRGKQLLMATNKKIFEISKEVGYDSPSYFNQVFKLHYGMTPKEYRQENREWNR